MRSSDELKMEEVLKLFGEEKTTRPDIGLRGHIFGVSDEAS
jgi:hypothetical protein